MFRQKLSKELTQDQCNIYFLSTFTKSNRLQMPKFGPDLKEISVIKLKTEKLKGKLYEISYFFKYNNVQHHSLYDAKNIDKSFKNANTSSGTVHRFIYIDHICLLCNYAYIYRIVQ